MKKMTVGKIIRKIRRDKDLTQYELAQKAGISPVTLCRVESGINQPNPATLVVIAKALNVKVEELVK